MKTTKNNKINLCDSCLGDYPNCNTEVIFGDGLGLDNICACNGYVPNNEVSEKTTKQLNKAVELLEEILQDTLAPDIDEFVHSIKVENK